MTVDPYLRLALAADAATQPPSFPPGHPIDGPAVQPAAALRFPAHVVLPRDAPVPPRLQASHAHGVGPQLWANLTLDELRELEKETGGRVTLARPLGAEALPAESRNATQKQIVPAEFVQDDGRNAILGLIDTGLDVQHPAFAGALDGTSRIRGVWDLRSAAPPTTQCCPVDLDPGKFAESFGGTFYDSPTLTEYMRNGGAPAELRDADGHGTAVASLAVGIPLPAAIPPFPGSDAPAAEIWAVLIAEVPGSVHAVMALAFFAAVQRRRGLPLFAT